MIKPLLEEIVAKAKEEKKGLFLVFSAVRSYGGYSSGSANVVLDLNKAQVSLEPLCLKISSLTSMCVKKSYGDEVDYYDFGLSCKKQAIDELYVPYDQILMAGLEK